MDFGALLSFLKDLKKNNNREWFQASNDRYQGLKTDFSEFVGELLTQIVKFDPEVADLKPKDCMFRINRDIRFSADKSPYKTNFGAYVVAGGKKSPKAGYYFHVEPGGSFIGGGLWMPPSDILNSVRQEIDYNQKEFETLLKAPSFRKYFDGLEGDSLKTAPKGYPADHPLIEILKKKSFVMVHNLSDKELKETDAKKVAVTHKAMKPVLDFFNRTFATE